MQQTWMIVLKMFHEKLTLFLEDMHMDKENRTYSMSIRVSEQELDCLKRAARLEVYSSYSEFVRRTALIEASKILYEKESKGSKSDGR